MQTLAKLFGGPAPVRVMRLFLLNPERSLELSDIVKKAIISPRAARAEIVRLLEAGLIKRTSFFVDIPEKAKKGKKGKTKKKRVSGFALDQSFGHLYALRMLLFGADIVDKKNVVLRLQKVGKIKLVVLAGIFLRDDDGRIDLLVVGDGLNGKRLEHALRAIESDIGKELRYAAMDTKEFHYRLGMYDKFIRDVFDCPHEKLVDRIGIVV